MTGIRSIRSLVLIAVAAAGVTGAAPAPQPAPAALQIDYMYCLSLGHGRMECQASVSGASGTVSYDWTPNPYAGSGDHVLIYCNAYQYKTVSLTVTDTGGGYDSTSGQFYCGDAV